jgi:hypothetical protein
MDRAWAGACAGLAIIALASTPQGVLAETAHAAPKLMTFGDLRARPLPKPSARIAYGELPEQFVELWLPQGTGPFPVVVMVHGGCWLSNAATLEIMNFAAEDLRRRSRRAKRRRRAIQAAARRCRRGRPFGRRASGVLAGGAAQDRPDQRAIRRRAPAHAGRDQPGRSAGFAPGS